MSAWIHCHIYNKSSYDLKMVEKHVNGSGILGVNGTPQWHGEPPAVISAANGADVAFSAWNDPWLSNIGLSVTYEADVDGFPLRIVFMASANEHPAGTQGEEARRSKDNMINVRTTTRSLRGNAEREIHWTLKDWPD